MILLVLLGGLARIYLGVHSIKCVLIGWVIGLTFSIIFYESWNSIWSWFDDELTVVWMIILTIFLVLLQYGILYSLKHYIMNDPYTEDVMYYWKLAGIKNTYGLSDAHARYVLAKNRNLPNTAATITTNSDSKEMERLVSGEYDTITISGDDGNDNGKNYEIDEELKESLYELANKLAFLHVGERDMDHYDPEIMPLFGGITGIIIQKADKSLMTFMYEDCHVSDSHDLSVILYRELIGYVVSLLFGFTTLFIFPAMLRKRNYILMASICGKIVEFHSAK